jgi:hypothetical protein
MSETSTLIPGHGAVRMTRQDLMALPVPVATRTHVPVPHHEITQALIETLGFRHIKVVNEEYAATPDGAKMFGVLDLDQEFGGCRFSIGLRNSNDKSMRLALTVGYRVMVCANMAFAGDFEPVLAKHSKSMNLIDLVSVGVDKMQRNFEPLIQTVGEWQKISLTDEYAKAIIYEAFVEGQMDIPMKLINGVHQAYFEPDHDEFRDRNLWSLSNAFTHGFKELAPLQQFRATGKLPPFIDKFNRPF